MLMLLSIMIGSAAFKLSLRVHVAQAAKPGHAGPVPSQGRSGVTRQVGAGITVMTLSLPEGTCPRPWRTKNPSELLIKKILNELTQSRDGSLYSNPIKSFFLQTLLGFEPATSKSSVFCFANSANATIRLPMKHDLY